MGLITAAALTAACNSAPAKSQQEQLVEQVRAAVAAGTEQTVDPSDIVDSYRRNPVDADSTYKGHVLRMQVVVDEIAVDRDGVPFVGLRASHEAKGTEVACTFNDDRSQVHGLSPGSEIIVRGFFVGQMAGSPLFMGCQIEKRGWPTTPPTKFVSPPDPGVDAWEWNKNIFPALNKAGVKFEFHWITNTSLWLESKQCPAAKAVFDKLGRTPYGYVVTCTLPDVLPSKAEWRESNP